ncbi:MAG: acyl-CoA thioesterase [Bacteroidota bacterium]
MNHFSKQLDIRWSDLDPNFHLRHSVYYDYGAYARISFFTETGLTMQVLASKNFGPIIFREECLFKKEIHFGDKLEITTALVKARPDYSRWTIVHELWKNGDTLAAFITVDGAWLDTVKRKLYQPDEFLIKVFGQIPKHQDFVFEDKK